MGRLGALHALIYKVGDTWHAQWLEHDIEARAKTPEDVLSALDRAIAAHRAVALENGLNELSGVPEAPAFFREMFARGLTVEPKVRRLKSSAVAPVPEVRLSEPYAPA